MRSTKLIAGLAFALAVSAAAQEVPADPPATPEETKSGLSDLSETVSQLSDDPTAEATEQPKLETQDVLSAEPTDEPGQLEASPSQEPAAERTDSEPEPPASPSGPPPELTADQRSEIDRAALRGRQLIAIAQAGMLATQDMLSRVADPEGAGIAGWVALPEGNAMAVTFYADTDEGPVGVYRARVLGGRTVSRETFLTGERPPLTGTELRMARARDASESEELRSCTNQPFNVLVVPPSSATAPIDVYRITPPESRGRVPLGGHFRSRMMADGSVSEPHAFTRGCLNVDAGETPTGVQPGPIAVTHLTSDLPTEIHIFLSMFSGRPLIVAAGDPTRLFMVTGDTVREIRR